MQHDEWCTTGDGGGGLVWHPAARAAFGHCQNGRGDRCRREAARDQCAKQIKGCDAAAEKAQGMLVFPEVTKAAIGVGGSYGEGALIVGDKNAGYYSTTAASIGLQLGAEKYAQIIMFMTPEALDQFRNSSGWEAGANAQVAMIDEGKAADIGWSWQNAGHRFRLRSEGPDGRSFRRGLQDHQAGALSRR